LPPRRTTGRRGQRDAGGRRDRGGRRDAQGEPDAWGGDEGARAWIVMKIGTHGSNLASTLSRKWISGVRGRVYSPPIGGGHGDGGTARQVLRLHRPDPARTTEERPNCTAHTGCFHKAERWSLMAETPLRRIAPGCRGCCRSVMNPARQRDIRRFITQGKVMQ
jgi:hypothetical protein